MKSAIFIGLLAAFISLPVMAYKNYSPEHPQHVEGYDRQDGTHVNEYYRAEPGQKQSDTFGDGRSRDNF